MTTTSQFNGRFLIMSRIILMTTKDQLRCILTGIPEVLWWYRNLVGAQCFSIQGYKRNKIYPDFVVQQGHNEKPVATVVVVESKGKHLKGNEDTNYKRKVASYFEKVGYKVPVAETRRRF